MEYPQAILLGNQLYERYRDELEIRTAHEIAHQWWYGLVGNDPVTYPWMDEGLAEYSSRIYYEAMRGRAFADVLQLQRWQAVLDLLMGRGKDAPLNLPVMAYEDGSVYETVVYGKGALFYGAMRQSLGERPFAELLRAYVAEHRYGIVHPPDLWTAMDARNPQVADSLYRQWIGDPPTPPALPAAELSGTANSP